MHTRTEEEQAAIEELMEDEDLIRSLGGYVLESDESVSSANEAWRRNYQLVSAYYFAKETKEQQ